MILTHVWEEMTNVKQCGSGNMVHRTTMLTCKLSTLLWVYISRVYPKCFMYDFNYYYDCVKCYFTLILQLGEKEIKTQSLIPIIKELGLKFSVDSEVSHLVQILSLKTNQP